MEKCNLRRQRFGELSLEVIRRHFNRTRTILLALILLGFFYRAYLHLFVETGWIPCDEIINWITVRNLVTTGQPVNLSYYPHGMHFLIYGIWLLIPKTNPETLCMFFNPLIGALTIPIFFYLMKQFVDTRNALFSSLIFTFSEAYFYRSASFGSSEPLGILLMLGAFCFLVKRRYVLCGVCMVLTYEVHLLPFFFGFAVLGTLLLIQHRSKKSLLILIIATVTTIGLFYTNLFPYQRQLSFISPLIMIDRVNVQNLEVFSLNELLTYGLAFSGSLLTFFLGLGGFRRAHTFAKVWLIIAVLMTFILLITYNALTLGPYRMVVYISMGAIFLYSFLKIPHKLTFTGIILIFMVLSPTLFNGNNLIFRVNDSVTNEEIKAIEWATMNDNITNVNLVATDYSVIEYWLLYISPKSVINPEFNYELFRTIVNARKDYLEGNSSSIEFQFVFLSKRIEEQALFEEWRGIRTYQYHKPILDRWFNDPEWEQIYNKDGVKIYRRINLVAP